MREREFFLKENYRLAKSLIAKAGFSSGLRKGDSDHTCAENKKENK